MIHPTSAIGFYFYMLVVFSIVKSGEVGLAIPMEFFPMEFTARTTARILSPAQAGQNEFNIDVGSLLIATSPSVVPIDVPLM